MIALALASFTEIEVVADDALVAMTDNWIHPTTVASNISVNNGRRGLLRLLAANLRVSDGAGDLFGHLLRKLWNNLVESARD